MIKFEEYQLIFYQMELKKSEKMIEDLTLENMLFSLASLKLEMENMKLRGELHCGNFRQHTNTNHLIFISSFNINSNKKTNKN